jgi:PTS system fructose-specific IIA component/PTS system nitrogen regulatory IIA component
MRMSDFVVRESISATLAADTKEAAIREMVENLRLAGYFKGNEPEEIVKAIQKRELLGSTGIGRGVAIPHTKHYSVDRLIGTVAVSRGGVPFDSIDGEPVHLLFMLVSPQERPSDHLRALEGVSRSLRDDAFVRQLRQAATPQQVWELIVEQDRRHGG